MKGSYCANSREESDGGKGRKDKTRKGGGCSCHKENSHEYKDKANLLTAEAKFVTFLLYM